MTFRTIHGAAVAFAAVVALASLPGAMAQSGTANPQTQSTPADPAASNPTTGVAPADQPVERLPSTNDAAKFNAAADAGDRMPILALSLMLTNEQRRLISQALNKSGQSKGSTERPGFTPEVTALMPDAATVADLPGDLTAQIPQLKPYKYAVIGDKVLLVDPVNSFVVVGIVNL